MHSINSTDLPVHDGGCLNSKMPVELDRLVRRKLSFTSQEKVSDWVKTSFSREPPSKA